MGADQTESLTLDDDERVIVWWHQDETLSEFIDRVRSDNLVPLPQVAAFVLITVGGSGYTDPPQWIEGDGCRVVPVLTLAVEAREGNEEKIMSAVMVLEQIFEESIGSSCHDDPKDAFLRHQSWLENQDPAETLNLVDPSPFRLWFAACLCKSWNEAGDEEKQCLESMIMTLVCPAKMDAFRKRVLENAETFLPSVTDYCEYLNTGGYQGKQPRELEIEISRREHKQGRALSDDEKKDVIREWLEKQKNDVQSIVGELGKTLGGENKAVARMKAERFVNDHADVLFQE